MKHAAIRIWLVFAVLAVVTRGAAAQNERERFERQLEQIRQETFTFGTSDVPPDQRALIDFGAYFVFDYLSVDDNLNNNHVLRQYSLIAYTRLNLDEANEIFLRSRFVYQDFNDGDSFDNLGDEFLDPDLDRAYYRFDLSRARRAKGIKTNWNLIVQGGRDYVNWANGLTLSNVLDGVVVNFSAGPFALSAIAGVTPVRTVDFDSSRPNFDHNTRRGFYGGMLVADLGNHRPFFYGLVQRDYNQDDEFSLGSVETKFDYNSFYVGFGSTGSLTDRLLYGVEVVYEGGDTLSNSFTITPPFLTAVDQTRDSIQAWAADARLDYLFNDPRRTRIGLEFLVASGDSDRLSTSNTFGGNRTGTKDHAFNAFGLINTGLAYAPEVSNLMMLHFGASTFPLTDFRRFRQLQTGTDLFVYWKTEADAPIAEPTTDGRFLGWEPDIYMNWQITSDVTLALRYGVFFPSSDTYVSDEARQFFSMSMTFAF